MKKRFLSFMLSIVMCLTSVAALSSASVSAAEVVPVYLNNNPIEFPANDAQPQLINNRTYVPIRAVCDALGLSIDWNKSTETLTFAREGMTISHTMRTTIVYVNTKAQSFAGQPSINRNNRILMPIRMLAESIGATVEWDNTTRSVHISTAGNGGSNTQSDASSTSIVEFTSSAKTVKNGASVTLNVKANSNTDRVKFTNSATGADITEVNEYVSESDGTRRFEAKIDCEGADNEDESTIKINAIPGTATAYNENASNIKTVEITVSDKSTDSKDDKKDNKNDDDDDDDDEKTVKDFESDHFVKLVYETSVQKNGYCKFTVTTDDEVKRVKVDSTAADESVVIKDYDDEDDERVFEGKIKLNSTGTQKIKIDLYLNKDGYEDINESFEVKVGSSSSSKKDSDNDGDDELLDIEIVNENFYVSVSSPIIVTTTTGIDYIEVVSDEDERVVGKTSFTSSKTSSEKVWDVDITVSETGRNRYTVYAYKDDEKVDEDNITLNGKKFSRTEPMVLSMSQKSSTIKAGEDATFTAKVTGCVTKVEIRKDGGGSILGSGSSTSSSSSTKNMSVNFEVSSGERYYTAYAYDSSGASSTYTFKITGDTYEEIEITDIEIEDDKVPYGDPVGITVYTTNSCEKLWVENARGEKASRTYSKPTEEDGDEYIWEVDFSTVEDSYKASRSYTIIAQGEDKDDTDEKTITIHFTNTND